MVSNDPTPTTIVAGKFVAELLNHHHLRRWSIIWCLWMTRWWRANSCDTQDVYFYQQAVQYLTYNKFILIARLWWELYGKYWENSTIECDIFLLEVKMNNPKHIMWIVSLFCEQFCYTFIQWHSGLLETIGHIAVSPHFSPKWIVLGKYM